MAPDLPAERAARGQGPFPRLILCPFGSEIQFSILTKELVLGWWFDFFFISIKTGKSLRMI